MGTTTRSRTFAPPVLALALLPLIAAVPDAWAADPGQRRWYRGDPIEGGIMFPCHGDRVVQGAEVSCSVYASDWDRWTGVNEQGEPISDWEQDGPLRYRWLKTKGHFTGSGSSVTWHAPTDYVGPVSIGVVVNDPPGRHVPPGDRGTRNDRSVGGYVVVTVVPPDPPDDDDGGGGGGGDDPTDWAPDEGIHPFEGISVMPEDGQVVETGEECLVAAHYGDLDLATKPNGDTYHDRDPLTITVQASAGTLPEGNTYSSSDASWGVVWKAPDTPQTVQFTFTIDDAEGPHVPPGDTGTRDDPPVTLTTSVIVGRVNLIADANNNGAIDAADDTDAVEESWGRIVGYNADDDDGNAQRDKHDLTVAGEDDLAAVTLTVSSGLPEGCKVTLWQSSYYSGHKILGLWHSPEKAAEVPLPDTYDEADTNVIHTVGGAPLPSPLYVEGYSTLTRAYLQMRLLDPDGDLVASDKVRFTPVKLRPRAAGQATTVTVFKEASCLDWGDLADISFGDGITVVERCDDGYIKIAIAPDAPVGKRDVQIRPGAVLRNGFRVVEARLTGDYDADGDIEASDEQEQRDGERLLLAVNRNDSDDDGTVDMANTRIDGADDLTDMRKLQIVTDMGGLKGVVWIRSDLGDVDDVRAFSYTGAADTATVAIGPTGHTGTSFPLDGAATTLTFYAEALDSGPNVEPEVRISLEDTLGTEIELGQAVIPTTTFDAHIGVDGNQDGQIDFTDTEDKALTFWVNDDKDTRHKVDEGVHGPLLVGIPEEDDVEVSSGDEDHNDDHIGNSTYLGQSSCKRDLEDFTRLHLAIDPAEVLDDLTVQCRLRFASGASGSPKINIFQAVAPDTLYLKDVTTADAQRLKQKLATISVNGDVSLSNSQFKADLSTFGDRSPYIFEGAGAGECDLELVIMRSGNVICTRDVRLTLKAIKDMYERWTVVDEDAKDTPYATASPVDAFSYPAPDPSSSDETTYILHVHGWNMEAWEKDRWAETAYKRLWWQGYRGRFGLFRWPTMEEAIDWSLGWPVAMGTYNASEYRAWQSAQGLRKLIKDKITTGYKLHITAHSMGNIVVGEALRQYGETSPLEAKRVQAYIATQAAVPTQMHHRAFTEGSPWSGYETPNCCAHYYSGEFFNDDVIVNDTHDVGEDIWEDKGSSTTAATTVAPYDDGVDEKMYEGAAWTTSNGTSGKRSPHSYFKPATMQMASVSFINFFNPGDWALDWWWTNNRFKLDDPLPGGSDYGFSSELGFWVDHGIGHPKQTLRFDNGDTRFLIFAYCVESRVRALGASSGVGGAFDAGKQVDLSGTSFGYDDRHPGHSKQFRCCIQLQHPYWDEVLKKFQLKD